MGCNAVLPANSDIIYPGRADASFFPVPGEGGGAESQHKHSGWSADGGVGRRRLRWSKNMSDAEKIQGFQAADAKSKISYSET